MTGGRLTAGVVRIDNTVRRPASPKSPFTAELLQLLEHKGFTAAPRYLGQDAEARDILTYLDGWVPAKFQLWQDDQIAAAGTLLRAFHDATKDTHLATHHPVICHHDPGPNNFVFRDNLPVALIDFDLAAPGSPLEDLGYAAWTWCITSKSSDVHSQAAQVRLLADAYGLPAAHRPALIDAVLERQSRNARFWTETPTPATPAQQAARITWSHREHAFTTTNRHLFEAALA